jgi:hypothetical protein
MEERLYLISAISSGYEKEQQHVRHACNTSTLQFCVLLIYLLAIFDSLSNDHIGYFLDGLGLMVPSGNFRKRSAM